MNEEQIRAIEAINAYFISGNDIPVERATIKREEWELAKAALASKAKSVPELIVKVSRFEESNGNVWWSVFLSRDASGKLWNDYQVYSSTVEGRAEYEAARLKHFLGQAPEPDLLSFDTTPAPQAPTDGERVRELEKDAARYRWLKDNAKSKRWQHVFDDWNDIAPFGLSEYIDEAMKGE